MKTLKFALLIGVVMVIILAFKVKGVIGILMGVAAIDLLFTVFGRPLFKPGPLAKFLYGFDDMKLSFDEWYEINEEEINIELAETGADREMDFDSEREFDRRYEDYLTE